MLGPNFLTFFGIQSQTLWTEWIVSFGFALVASLIIRQFIWMVSPMLRADAISRRAGFRVDLAILASLALTFSSLMPIPVHGNPMVQSLIRLFFSVVILQSIWAAIHLLFESPTFLSSLESRTPNKSSSIKKRLLPLAKTLALLWFAGAYLQDFLPLSFLGSWVFVVLMVGVVYAATPSLTDFIEGLWLLNLQKGSLDQEIVLKVQDQLIKGKVVQIGWTHFVFECSSEPKILELNNRLLYRRFLSN